MITGPLIGDDVRVCVSNLSHPVFYFELLIGILLRVPATTETRKLTVFSCPALLPSRLFRDKALKDPRHHMDLGFL